MEDNEAGIEYYWVPIYETKTASMGSKDIHIHYVTDTEHERLITYSLKKHADIWEDLSRR